MSEKRREYICAWVKPSEKIEVVAMAKQTHLKTSELIRRLVLGRKLPDSHRHEAVLALTQINADQARLGNLLRMAMADEDFVPPENVNLDHLLQEVRETQDLIKIKIKKISLK